MKALIVIATLSLTVIAQSQSAEIADIVSKTAYKPKQDAQIVYNIVPGIGEAAEITLSVEKDFKDAKTLTENVLEAIKKRVPSANLITVRAVYHYKYSVPIGTSRYVSTMRINTVRIGNIWTTTVTGGDIREVPAYMKRMQGEKVLAVSHFDNLPKAANRKDPIKTDTPKERALPKGREIIY